ncbi:hypothetical protein [Herbaspirillum sp. YR522]|uniref:hypothetical protein n=1 Tax=Herbaspirillum sp. YR522 TaxID=1144342 RepID=UPI0012F7797E|nr:hypothetical protein [Herbaspirillum sp. YR522]
MRFIIELCVGDWLGRGFYSFLWRKKHAHCVSALGSRAHSNRLAVLGQGLHQHAILAPSGGMVAAGRIILWIGQRWPIVI